MSIIYVLLISAAVSLIGLIGGVVLIWKESWTRRAGGFLLSFAAGSLLAATFFDLLPEALDRTEESRHADLGLAILIGILLFFLLEKLLVWHHHSHSHIVESAADPAGKLAAARPIIILGDALHNLLDGAVIAVAFLTDTRLGIITALAVVAHEIPQEIGDFGILLNSGMKRISVFAWNLIGAVVSVIGVAIIYLAADTFEKIEGLMLGFVAGTFLYIALADLIPTIHHEKYFKRSLIQIGCLLLGIGLLWWIGVALPE